MTLSVENGTDWYFFLILACGVLLQWRFKIKTKRRKEEPTNTEEEKTRTRARDLVSQLKKHKQKRLLKEPQTPTAQISPRQNADSDVNLNTAQTIKENKSTYLNCQHAPTYDTDKLREFMKMQAILGPPVSMRGEAYAEERQTE